MRMKIITPEGLRYFTSIDVFTRNSYEVIVVIEVLKTNCWHATAVNRVERHACMPMSLTRAW